MEVPWRAHLVVRRTRPACSCSGAVANGDAAAVLEAHLCAQSQDDHRQEPLRQRAASCVASRLHAPACVLSSFDACTDDETRVRLAKLSHDPTSDYINASHITVKRGQCEFSAHARWCCAAHAGRRQSSLHRRVRAAADDVQRLLAHGLGAGARAQPANERERVCSNLSINAAVAGGTNGRHAHAREGEGQSDEPT